MAGLLLHSMANMRTTITNVLVLMTGGVIISYVEKKKNRKIGQKIMGHLTWISLKKNFRSRH